MIDKSTDEQVDAALAALDQPLGPAADPAHPAEQPSGESGPPSPTLAALDQSRRPSPEVVCATCLNSVWFASRSEVKCYCRVMFLVTWSTKEPNPITHCDGVFLGQPD
jgi:hypothetical protein